MLHCTVYPSSFAEILLKHLQTEACWFEQSFAKTKCSLLFVLYEVGASLNTSLFSFEKATEISLSNGYCMFSQ